MSVLVLPTTTIEGEIIRKFVLGQERIGREDKK